MTGSDVKQMLLNIEHQTGSRVHVGSSDRTGLISVDFELKEIPDDHLFYTEIAESINKQAPSIMTRKAFEGALISEVFAWMQDMDHVGKAKVILDFLDGLGVLREFRNDR